MPTLDNLWTECAPSSHDVWPGPLGGSFCATQGVRSTGPAPHDSGSERPSRATVCYMRTVTHREMRNSSGEILRAVAAGESVQVTNNGQIAAVISPPPSGDPLAELV